MSDGGEGADRFVETTTQGFFSRLGGALMAPLVGVLMVIGSIVLLSWNEGRAVDAATALSAGAGSVVSVPAGAPDPANDGRLVHVAGAASVGEPLRDPVLGVAWNGLLRMRRTVEMYQWQQRETTRTEKQLGGSEKTETVYEYERVWSEQPIDSGRFRIPDGHRNPSMPLRTVTLDSRDARVGGHAVTPAVLANLSTFQELTPGTAAVDPAYRLADGGLYRGADPMAPKVGDVRVRFEGVVAQPISVVAAQSRGGLIPYTAANGYTIALIQVGERPAAAMFADAQQAETVITWILRLVGWVVMAIGVMLFFQPFVVLASVLPFLEPLASAGAALLGFVLATPATLVTIAVAWVAHRPLLAAGLGVAAVLALVGGLMMRRRGGGTVGAAARFG
ncbi:TMEM43 family protein [Azospirillum sp.]|uniref:TMEM43 family protein n=1 Tax=Azospirillum sp. TaxID=34012 RepID=UPI002D409F34|nr:TMEM43 family protein [Azospirillum sp.]HYD64606.1 TMEM43 family protein [Azospirillum sp.]